PRYRDLELLCGRRLAAVARFHPLRRLGSLPNPNGYMNSKKIHAYFEGEFVKGNLSRSAVATEVGAYQPCGCTIEQRTDQLLRRPGRATEPDSLGISRSAPCDEGRWLLDPQSVCRIWDWHPAPEDTSTWTGASGRAKRRARGRAMD